jgi:hypothetical protein
MPKNKILIFIKLSFTSIFAEINETNIYFFYKNETNIY